MFIRRSLTGTRCGSSSEYTRRDDFQLTSPPTATNTPTATVPAWESGQDVRSRDHWACTSRSGQMLHKYSVSKESARAGGYDTWGFIMSGQWTMSTTRAAASIYTTWVWSTRRSQNGRLGSEAPKVENMSEFQRGELHHEYRPNA